LLTMQSADIAVGQTAIAIRPPPVLSLVSDFARMAPSGSGHGIFLYQRLSKILAESRKGIEEACFETASHRRMWRLTQYGAEE
jgi:hypothetical protein